MLLWVIAHALARLGLGEAPLDSLTPFVRGFVPGGSLALQSLQIPKAAIPQALSGVPADGDLGLIEPTGMHWCVVDFKAIPDLARHLLDEGQPHRPFTLRRWQP